jgi:malate dehydrogenase (oxaloacetate-decarboxylating)(NADP+)
MLSIHLTKRYLTKPSCVLTLTRLYSKKHDDQTKHDVTQVKGVELLRSPSLNKGMAFSIYERQLLGIHGLIPPAVITQDIQAMRVMANFRQEPNHLDRYVDLCNLQQRNEKLFYRVLIDNIEEVMPIVYTPTVGLACQKYGMTYRRANGLFITIHDKGHILDVLYNWPEPLVKVCPFFLPS